MIELLTTQTVMKKNKQFEREIRWMLDEIHKELSYLYEVTKPSPAFLGKILINFSLRNEKPFSHIIQVRLLKILAYRGVIVKLHDLRYEADREKAYIAIQLRFKSEMANQFHALCSQHEGQSVINKPPTTQQFMRHEDGSISLYIPVDREESLGHQDAIPDFAFVIDEKRFQEAYNPLRQTPNNEINFENKYHLSLQPKKHDDIHCRIVDYMRVKFTVKSTGESEEKDFCEIGLAHKNGQLTQMGEMFMLAAQDYGNLSKDMLKKPSVNDYPALRKGTAKWKTLLYRFRNHLKTLFGVNDDPFNEPEKLFSGDELREARKQSLQVDSSALTFRLKMQIIPLKDKQR